MVEVAIIIHQKSWLGVFQRKPPHKEHIFIDASQTCALIALQS